MNRTLKAFLKTLIKYNYISVFNDENSSEYTIPAPDIAGFLVDPSATSSQTDDFEEFDNENFYISCEYFVEGTVPSGRYTLKYGDIVIETAQSPIFSTKKTSTARDLILLARACSKKIIAQQKMAQKRDMIMGMLNNYDQYMN